MPKVIHYAGELNWTDKRGASSHVYAGWAACCSGDRARDVRREGNHTYEPTEVTCKPCLLRLAWAGRVAPVPITPLDKAEAYIKALEEHIERQHTCVVCQGCLLLPNEAPPHCQDTCHPDEDQEIAWQESYLDDPVQQLRAKFGR
jgi:hypothetical protein